MTITAQQLPLLSGRDRIMITVTVIAATAARAEVLTKPGFLRTIDDYLEWIPTRGAAALLIDADGAEHTTTNWSDYA